MKDWGVVLKKIIGIKMVVKGVLLQPKKIVRGVFRRSDMGS